MTVICYRNLIDVELLYRANTFNVLNNGRTNKKVTHYITHVLLFPRKTGGQVFELKGGHKSTKVIQVKRGC